LLTAYLAQVFDAIDLANGIAWVVSQLNARRLRSQAREKVLVRFSRSVVAQQYFENYDSILASNENETAERY